MMKLLRTVVIALLVVGCDEDKRNDVAKINYLPVLPQYSDETLDRVSEHLGLEIVVEDLAPITVIKMDRPFEHHAGATEWIAPPCIVNVWAVEDDLILAHELGHALGLQHVDDIENLMYPTINYGNLTDEQVDRMRHIAWVEQYSSECK
jgi:matrixin